MFTLKGGFAEYKVKKGRRRSEDKVVSEPRMREGAIWGQSSRQKGRMGVCLEGPASPWGGCGRGSTGEKRRGTERQREGLQSSVHGGS